MRYVSYERFERYERKTPCRYKMYNETEELEVEETLLSLQYLNHRRKHSAGAARRRPDYTHRRSVAPLARSRNKSIFHHTKLFLIIYPPKLSGEEM